MNLQTERYEEQQQHWPAQGRHILAQYDSDSVVVYQAYRPEIAEWAVAHQQFGGPFSYSRMSWLKPNFLWMMFRCGWATKVDQERVLAVRITRAGFEQMLRSAVHSAFTPSVYATQDQWAARVRESDTRLQWDPDHGPQGQPLQRRAIQLGLAQETLKAYGTQWVRSIEDVTPFVAEQKANAVKGQEHELLLPRERVYVPADVESVKHLELTVG